MNYAKKICGNILGDKNIITKSKIKIDIKSRNFVGVSFKGWKVIKAIPGYLLYLKMTSKEKGEWFSIEYKLEKDINRPYYEGSKVFIYKSGEYYSPNNYYNVNSIFRYKIPDKLIKRIEKRIGNKMSKNAINILLNKKNIKNSYYKTAGGTYMSKEDEKKHAKEIETMIKYDKRMKSPNFPKSIYNI